VDPGLWWVEAQVPAGMEVINTPNPIQVYIAANSQLELSFALVLLPTLTPTFTATPSLTATSSATASPTGKATWTPTGTPTQTPEVHYVYLPLLIVAR
jgi:hypothetical protein